jgi:hypothetical protein
VINGGTAHSADQSRHPLDRHRRVRSRAANTENLTAQRTLTLTLNNARAHDQYVGQLDAGG